MRISDWSSDVCSSDLYRFDEDVTGLEDMELAQRLCQSRGRIGYVAEACVYHHHAESWSQVQRRFEREALALQKIMPQIHVRHRDAIRYIFSSIWHDWRCALRERSEEHTSELQSLM